MYLRICKIPVGRKLRIKMTNIQRFYNSLRYYHSSRTVHNRRHHKIRCGTVENYIPMIIKMVLINAQ